MLINGVPGNSISIHDRGLLYGDGIFRTMRVGNGLVKNWPRHYDKLLHDCTALNLDCPAEPTLANDLDQLIGIQSDGVAKIIITRGASTRGYAPPQDPVATRVVSISPVPDYSDVLASHGIRAHICRLQLAHQPRLAGIKHLNRLENVLAAAELTDSDSHEGIILDMAGNVIEATRSNLFIVRNGALFTPNLSNCGVAGMQRDRVMDWAKHNGVNCEIAELCLADLLAADEVFLVNSIIGLWPVREMPGFRREQFQVSLRIQYWLNHENS